MGDPTETPTKPDTDPDPDTCDHGILQPSFDEEAAKAVLELYGSGPKGVAEVRRRWPRFDGFCPACKQSYILYASKAHYVYGDW